MLQSSIRTMAALRSEPHCCAIAAAGSGLLIIGSARMPGQPHENRAIRPVVVVLVLLKPRGYRVVHFLVVLLGGGEDLGRGWGAVLAPEVVSGATSCGGTGGPEEGVG